MLSAILCDILADLISASMTCARIVSAVGLSGSDNPESCSGNVPYAERSLWIVEVADALRAAFRSPVWSVGTPSAPFPALSFVVSASGVFCWSISV